MANGDITKEIEYDKIEVVSTWNIQVRQATKIMEEQADGSKIELTRSFHRHVLVPFSSSKSVTNSVAAATSVMLEAGIAYQTNQTGGFVGATNDNAATMTILYNTDGDFFGLQAQNGSLGANDQIRFVVTYKVQ